MPINRRYPVGEVVDACRFYCQRRGRRISIEYVHLPGLNDLQEDVLALATLLGDLPATVNVIPYNEITQAGYRPPTPSEVEDFASRLRQALRQPVSVRERRGDDVGAACGQLWVHRNTSRTG